MFQPTVRTLLIVVLGFLTLVDSAAPLAATSASPQVVSLVEVSALEQGALTLGWLPARDDNTLHENLLYRVYLSETADFLPDNATLKWQQAGANSAHISDLKPATTYFAVVTATDTDGNVSWSNRLEGKTTALKYLSRAAFPSWSAARSK